MAQPFDLSKPNRPVHVGVIIMKGETELLDVAPVDLIHGLSRHFVSNFPDGMGPPGIKEAAIDFKFHWVTEAGPDTPAILSAGLRIVPTDSFETCPPLDIVLVGAAHITYTLSAAELAFARKSYEDCSAFIAVCGGVDIPRRAGLLDGKAATGPRPVLSAWRAESPGIDWVERRWVRDGKMWTSGALLNGCDLVHNFAKQVWGQDDSPRAVLVDMTAKMGAWPDRDVEYKDVSWEL